MARRKRKVLFIVIGLVLAAGAWAALQARRLTAEAEVLAAHPTVVADYKKGKQKAKGFLMGQVMKATKGQANTKLAQQVLAQLLEE